MDIMIYADLAQQTTNRTANDTDDRRLLNVLFGLIGEAGELADIVKKVQFQGHELDRDEFKDELGDLCWYIALAARSLPGQPQLEQENMTTQPTTEIAEAAGQQDIRYALVVLVPSSVEMRQRITREAKQFGTLFRFGSDDRDYLLIDTEVHDPYQITRLLTRAQYAPLEG